MTASMGTYSAFDNCGANNFYAVGALRYILLTNFIHKSFQPILTAISHNIPGYIRSGRMGAGTETRTPPPMTIVTGFLMLLSIDKP
jgi:hypothetical protein